MTGRPTLLRIGLLTAAVFIRAASGFAADKQIRPFIGATFHGDTTFVALGSAAGKPSVVVGASLVTMGEVFGVDVDLADAPGFFQPGDKHLVLSSRVTTLTGNFVVAAPRRLTEYVLRPYFVAGGGIMRVSLDDWGGAFTTRRVLPAFDLGGGVVGFLTNRVGISWEIRRFQNFYRQTEETGITFGHERLSYWRAGMAVVFRY